MNHFHLTNRRSAFTLIEIMVAMSIGFIVIAAAIQIHLWTSRIASSCEKKGWAQTRSMISSSKLLACVQQASAIVDIDGTDGNWVRLAYPGGGRALLSYTDSPTPNTGALLFQPEGGAEIWIINEGVSNYSKEEDSILPVFALAGSSTNLAINAINAIQIQYMVIKPTEGTDASENQRDAINISLSACLRNYAAPTP